LYYDSFIGIFFLAVPVDRPSLYLVPEKSSSWLKRYDEEEEEQEEEGRGQKFGTFHMFIAQSKINLFLCFDFVFTIITCKIF